MERLLGFLAVSGLLLCHASSAGAQQFRILAGQLGDATSGESAPLLGDLEFGLAPPPANILPGSGVDRFYIAGFELGSGDQVFAPSVQHAFDGLSSPLLLLQLPDALDLVGTDVSSLWLSSGGNVVGSSEDTVTFRNHTFFGNEGSAIDRTASGGGLPVRFGASGTLRSVDTTYRILREPCEPIVVLPPRVPPINPPPGGGVIIIGGSGGTIEIVDPGDAELVLSSGPDLRAESTLTIVTVGEPLSLPALPPGDATLIAVGGEAAVSVDLTLEDLGITAPEGATLTLAASGHVTVESDGDIDIDAGALDIEGLTRLIVVSATRITVGPSGLELPQGVALELQAGELELGGPLDVTPGDIEIDADSTVIIGDLFCPGLRYAGSQIVAEQPFELLAAVVVPVDVRLLGRARGRAPSRVVQVAILGSGELDVRDVDVRSLRFGPGEASPMRRPRRQDVNRDEIPDLLLRFPRAGISPGSGDACLTGATFHGPAIAGCAASDVAVRRGKGRR
jgi:hypothetical protein